MCAPMAIAAIGLALTAASTYSQVQAQQKAADSQAAYNQQQTENINYSRRANLANIEVQRQQNLADAREQVNRNTMAGRSAAATATVAAGEAGVSGTSVDALLRELQGRAAWDNMTAETNYLRQDTALNAQRENVIINSNSQLNSLTTPASPDYLGAAARFGQSGLNIYSNYQSDVASQSRTLRGTQTR